MTASVAERKEIIDTHKINAKDTGSAPVQVALLTRRINELSEHMQKHPKDLSSRRGLLAMVANRRNLLDYLKSKDEAAYKALIEKLGIRR
ncbi:MAG: 30S ribosomal protein S15 [Micavibrio aeruginosavorus]|nr:30S ribosomal protein S15 [Micavibrio aeruginosavorus]